MHLCLNWNHPSPDLAVSLHIRLPLMSPFCLLSFSSPVFSFSFILPISLTLFRYVFRALFIVYPCHFLRPAPGTVPCQVATHLGIDQSLPWVEEKPDSNLRLLHYGQIRYPWATSLHHFSIPFFHFFSQNDIGQYDPLPRGGGGVFVFASVNIPADLTKQLRTFTWTV